MLDSSICPWVCCIMVMFSHVFCWIVRFSNSWVYLCVQRFCCISTPIKCYLVLRHSWRSILHCESFAWLCCIMFMLVNWSCWITRFAMECFSRIPTCFNDYVALRHLWTLILDHEFSRWLCCIIVMFINWISRIMTFIIGFCNGWV